MIVTRNVFFALLLVFDIAVARAVTGVFFLLDDAFRVGEYIEAGPLKGTVEAISVRSLRLRHHRGAVHAVPYGELKSLTNQSRDWVIVKLKILVTYDTDVDRAVQAVQAVWRSGGLALREEGRKNLASPRRPPAPAAWRPRRCGAAFFHGAPQPCCFARVPAASSRSRRM